MAVAEKTSVRTTTSDPRQHLLVASALGTFYFLASLWLVFLGLPTLWRWVDVAGVSNPFLADSLLFLVTLPVIFGLFVLGKRLEGPHPVRGMRAGAAFLSAAILFSGLLITCGVPLWMFVGVGLAVGTIVLCIQPAFYSWLGQLEDQGWFHATSFKANQGLRVRRGTVVGLVVVAVFGVIALISHGTLHTGTWTILKPFATVGAAATDPWVVYTPFTDEKLVFMYYITLTVPVLLLIAAGWFSWRLVNWPSFGDFLIATEAEMNKVSWTTRKRLYQDTIVVLVTVFLFTLFLFLIDILWIKILTNPIIDVLKHDPQAAARKNQSGAQW